MLGVVRKQKSKATGSFTGTAYDSGAIAAGTWAVVSGTEIRFKVTEEVSFDEGTEFAIPVIAENAGLSYNIGSGTSIRLTRVISGLDTVTVGEDWLASPGQDEEDDNSYRDRIEDRWNSQILGDTKAVYRSYAESVDGVREAHIVRAPRGPGSTDVVIAAVNGVPSAELLAAVEAKLYDHELMAFDVDVKAPEIEPVTIEIEFTGNASEGDVRLAAESYVHNLKIGGRFKIKDLYDLYKPMGLETIEITSPDRDVQPADDAIIEATVTVTKAAA
jgi:phage-related baseplate assembly protein